MTCTSARSVILGLVRGTSTEADRLRLEQHLAGCTSCRAERAQWALVERVRDQPARTLSTVARARVLRRLVAEAAAPGVPEVMRAPRSVTRPWAIGFAAAAAAAALVVLGVRVVPSLRADARAGVLVAAGQLLGADGSAGSARIAGAQLWYPARSTVRLSDPRRVDLLDGEVEVEVTPGGPGRFRVYAPRFIVEVLGTRFVVRGDSVRTLHGTVRVLDRDERPLAVVRAGEVWRAAEPVARALEPAPAPRVEAVTPVAPVAVVTTPVATAGHDQSRSTPRTAASWLDEAQRALAAGRTAEARRAIRNALAAGTLPREHALADLATADAQRIDRQPARALAAYRLVADRWSHLPEGEQALFTLAQLHAERHADGEARAALEEYLGRYPAGRFQEVARSRLAALRSAP